MTPIDIVKPWKLLLGIPPLLYGALLLLELPQSTTWSFLVAGVLLVAVVVANHLEYPFLPLWPALVGLFLLSTCICALIEDVVDYAIVPFTDTDAEILVASVLACSYIGWGISTTRKMLAD